MNVWLVTGISHNVASATATHVAQLGIFVMKIVQDVSARYGS